MIIIATNHLGQLFKKSLQSWISCLLMELSPEAQYLLGDGIYSNGTTEGKTLKAMLFRIVRLWICKKRDDRQVVAVFTGTTASLTKFIIADDLKAKIKTDTREMTLLRQTLYKPFYTTTTVGCLRFLKGGLPSHDEYSVAVPFGRPLFASMNARELKNGEPDIVGRMVQLPKKWENSEAVWFSVLGTRVQMGQTTPPLASTLVAKSYANIVGVTDSEVGEKQLGSIKICFPPDPVCARLAMCLMDHEWSMPTLTLNGKEKTWWVDKMKNLYSKNLCSPEKGDLGEVMVALYFLFCADTLRCGLSKDYTIFSVALDQRLGRLVNGGQSRLKGRYDSSKKLKVARSPSNQNVCQVHFSAIQVCRNYVRAYDDSWSSLFDKVFLENMYRSGVGFYVFPGCGVIDLVFALRVVRNSENMYVPMFVSAKSHVYFSPGSAKKECKRMEAKAKDAEGSSHGALCLLVIFGSSSDSNDKDCALSESCYKDVAEGKIVSKVLRIPTDDAFGLSEAFLDLTTSRDEMSEVLASHSFLSAHREADKDRGSAYAKDFREKAIRLRPKLGKTGGRKDDSLTRSTRDLFEELDKIVLRKDTDQMDMS